MSKKKQNKALHRRIEMQKEITALVESLKKQRRTITENPTEHKRRTTLDQKEELQNSEDLIDMYRDGGKIYLEREDKDECSAIEDIYQAYSNETVAGKTLEFETKFSNDLHLPTSSVRQETPEYETKFFNDLYLPRNSVRQKSEAFLSGDEELQDGQEGILEQVCSAIIRNDPSFLLPLDREEPYDFEEDPTEMLSPPYFPPPDSPPPTRSSSSLMQRLEDASSWSDFVPLCDYFTQKPLLLPVNYTAEGHIAYKAHKKFSEFYRLIDYLDHVVDQDLREIITSSGQTKPAETASSVSRTAIINKLLSNQYQIEMDMFLAEVSYPRF